MGERIHWENKYTASGKYLGRPSRVFSFNGDCSRVRTENEIWKEEIRFEDIIALAEKGVTVFEIAKRLDVPYSTLRDVLRRFGQLENMDILRKTYRIDRKILREMAADGKTVSDISELFGCSPKTVRELIKKAKLTDDFRRNSDRRSQQKKRAKEKIVRQQYIDMAMQGTGDRE